MGDLIYPTPKDDYCPYGNRHFYGALCGQCRGNAKKRELERLAKTKEQVEKKRRQKELWDSIVWDTTPTDKGEKRV